MLDILNKILYKIKQLIQGYIFRDKIVLNHIEYIKLDRKFNLRYNYPLMKDEIVFDLGGHKGDWSAKILDKYSNVKIYIFEPFPDFYKIIEARFKKNSENIKVFPFGLGSKEQVINLSDDGLSTSIFSSNRENLINGYIESYLNFINSENIGDIALIKMNIEGGEYDLLKTILDNNLIHNIRDIQIQFHNYGSWSEEERNVLRARLATTHYLTYDFAWTFENWRRRF